MDLLSFSSTLYTKIPMSGYKPPNAKQITNGNTNTVNHSSFKFS